MTYIDTVVVGAGHAGLAVSRLLAATGHEHVVLERGRVGERWRTERWDSLHLLTPNWMNRLPGWEYRPPAPDAYLSAGGFVRLLDRYAASFDAPVIESANVEEVSRAPRASGHRYLVVTDQGTWRARQVVVATGPHGTPDRAGPLQRRRRRGGHIGAVPQSGAVAVRWRARRRRFGLGCADRRRACPGRPSGRARRRASYQDAPPLPRNGHLLVALEHRPPFPHGR